MPTPATATRSTSCARCASSSAPAPTAIQLEDQDFPKRCGHLDGKALIPAPEMCGKIRAALDARHSRETLIIARTDAVAVEGFERAIERARAYREAGADMLFVEAPKARDDLARIVAALGTAVPLMANMVEGGKTPPLSGGRARGARLRAGDLSRRDRARARRDHGERLLRLARRAWHERAVPHRMLDFDGINELIGTPEMIALGQRYETPTPPATRHGRPR